MRNLHYITTRALLSVFIQQMVLQQQLLEAQQQIIELQKRIDSLTPKNAPDAEIHWHIVSNGITSLDAANSEDLATLRKFLKWNLEFARKHIRPYVNPDVYGECVNQMTRGLAERIALLETKKESSKLAEQVTKAQKTCSKQQQLAQLTLIQ